MGPSCEAIFLLDRGPLAPCPRSFLCKLHTQCYAGVQKAGPLLNAHLRWYACISTLQTISTTTRRLGERGSGTSSHSTTRFFRNAVAQPTLCLALSVHVEDLWGGFRPCLFSHISHFTSDVVCLSFHTRSQSLQRGVSSPFSERSTQFPICCSRHCALKTFIITS